MILQNFLRRVVGNVLDNNSSSDIFLTLLLHERFNQKCPAILATASITGLTHSFST